VRTFRRAAGNHDPRQPVAVVRIEPNHATNDAIVGPRRTASARMASSVAATTSRGSTTGTSADGAIAAPAIATEPQSVQTPAAGTPMNDGLAQDGHAHEDDDEARAFMVDGSPPE